MENFEPALRVYYPQRITFQLRNILEVWNSIMLFGKSARKQNKLQILLTWYEKHFTISNDKELNTVIQNSPLKYTWKTQNVPQFSKCSSVSHFFPCLWTIVLILVCLFFLFWIFPDSRPPSVFLKLRHLVETPRTSKRQIMHDWMTYCKK